MSDGLRFIRFSVASPAGKKRTDFVAYLTVLLGYFYPACHSVTRGSTGTGAHLARTYTRLQVLPITWTLPMASPTHAGMETAVQSLVCTAQEHAQLQTLALPCRVLS